ncbi:MAG: sigma-54 dependent transcriptional regulator [Candidatus Contendobacter sp.]|nr:sigma-54 dependent transcriptional regulator [Candidatus Contendobacter sp.]MDS4057769.1 sigma-54 dependent transcriptional regulator [Candidatus Contendobacter sp.]
MASGRKRILVIDNDEAVCRMVEAILADRDYAVSAHVRSLDAMAGFAPGKHDLVITDIKMPIMSGLDVLQKVKQQDPAVPVIMITAHATVDLSIQALRQGAYDFLTKPFEPEELLSRIRNALRQTELIKENRELKEELAAWQGSIVGNSPHLLSLLETARKVAIRDIPVLISGESGTGKELVARAIRHYSRRREGKFVAINCGAIPETLLESELFGHRKGAFTGADRDHKGLIETADGGTLFLDEVGTLPPNVQKTLLRFLQEQEFYRVGDTTPIKVDVRVLSATNLDLQVAVQSGAFREDLYYRLNVVHLRLPPLRERRSDIPLLVAHFVKEQNKRFGTHVKGFDRQAVEAMVKYDWPGNIRQLGNVVQAAMAIDNSDYIGLDVLAQLIELPRNSAALAGDLSQLDYAAALTRFETEYLNRLLQASAGNIEDVAHRSGMNVATVYRKIKKYGLR